jgi:glycine hydroxymethyltransferase
VGTALTNKYAEGYPAATTAAASVDEVEALAIERAKRLFGSDHANASAALGLGREHGGVLRGARARRQDPGPRALRTAGT